MDGGRFPHYSGIERARALATRFYHDPPPTRAVCALCDRTDGLIPHGTFSLCPADDHLAAQVLLGPVSS